MPDVFTDWPACAEVLVSVNGVDRPVLRENDRVRAIVARIVGPPPAS